MSSRKRRFRLQNTNWILKSERGQISWSVGLFLVLFLSVCLYAAVQLERFRAASAYLEDALALSGLASIVVDIEEYGISHRISVGDIYGAYGKYREAVKGNLNLDDRWMAADGGVIAGEVRIVNYTVYNVNGDRVTVSCFDENGILTEEEYGLAGVEAPNGAAIESTSVYGEIVFMVEGFTGMHVEAHKGCLVDVVK